MSADGAQSDTIPPSIAGTPRALFDSWKGEDVKEVPVYGQVFCLPVSESISQVAACYVHSNAGHKVSNPKSLHPDVPLSDLPSDRGDGRALQNPAPNSSAILPSRGSTQPRYETLMLATG